MENETNEKKVKQLNKNFRSLNYKKKRYKYDRNLFNLWKKIFLNLTQRKC